MTVMLSNRHTLSSALEWDLGVQTESGMSGMRKNKGNTTHDVTHEE